MFELTIINELHGKSEVTQVYAFATYAELTRMLDAYGVPGVSSRTFRPGHYSYGGVGCRWAEVAETIADTPVRTRKHTYCGGTGTITLASGAPATCMGCSGTGRVPVYTAAQKRENERTAQRHMNAQAQIKACARSLAERVDNVEYLATSGMDHLHMHEPHRMEKLYQSVENGRVLDVVRALCTYRETISE